MNHSSISKRNRFFCVLLFSKHVQVGFLLSLLVFGCRRKGKTSRERTKISGIVYDLNFETTCTVRSMTRTVRYVLVIFFSFRFSKPPITGQILEGTERFIFVCDERFSRFDCFWSASFVLIFLSNYELPEHLFSVVCCCFSFLSVLLFVCFVSR